MSLRRLKEADSTNDVLKRALAGADGALPADGDAVYTDSQTAGRGRRGRAWENRPGEALYYSRLVRRPLADAVTLPLLCSLAAADAVRALCGQEAGVKWPNDLLLGGKKICGILCESVTAAGQTSYILGIGINLLQPEEFFAARGLVHGGSLLSQTGCPPLPTPALPPLPASTAASASTSAARSLPARCVAPPPPSTTPAGWWCARPPAPRPFLPARSRCTASTDPPAATTKEAPP